ncbi:hypothetical protein [Pseudobacteriovorax antillogorgiicola]|uniref:Uncharacterized protein n=1 Tax=Pseudobacteriovorax antillogorgiicola TaxID=1513793 RepID=A0A1Y6CSS8_9BACT|nr:hypothetical protein [Pseudobacteriovorax antillogorgiicola]TCS44992.1 hypothetical protein EDD56_13029 [Pseudobacteriovorax antillogorgiicola]SMF76610.1 hypothetical protein SAMN06296036_13045 [Pseudobacteriovorax antillogorgiicola]
MTFDQKFALLRWGSILTVFSLLTACGRSSSSTEHDTWDDQKPSSAQLACSEISILGDLELSGNYVYNILHCASNQSSSGTSSLPGILNAIDKLSPDGIQSLIDLLLLPNPEGQDREEVYPFLTVLSVAFDRGMNDQERDLYLAEERLYDLQNLLLGTNLNRSLELFERWSHQGQLRPLLETFGVFLSDIQDGRLGALSQELLQGHAIRPHLLPVTIEILRKRNLWRLIESQLTPKNTIPLTAPHQKEIMKSCLETWADTNPASEDENCLESSDIQLIPNDQITTGLDHWESYLEATGDTSLRAVIGSLFQIISYIQGLPPKERLDSTRKLLQISDDFLSTQGQPIKNLVAFLYQLNESSAADFKSSAEAAKKLLEPAFDPTLNKLRAKAGTSILTDYGIQLVRQGGVIPGCNDLTLPSLEEKFSSFDEAQELLGSYFRPHLSCGYLPPMVAAMGHKMGVQLSFDCSSSSAEPMCIQLPLDAYTKLYAPELTFRSDSEEDPKLTQALVVETLAETINELQRDPYYLWNWNLSSGPVYDVKRLEGLVGWSQSQQGGIYAIDIMKIDQQLEKEGLLFSRDFLERLLAIKVKKLASIGEQFYHLMPDGETMAADNRASRVFAGLYTDGPMIQVYRDRFQHEGILETLPASLKTSFQTNPSRLSLVLSKFKQVDSIFKNPHSNRQGQAEVQTITLGSNVLNYVGFDDSGYILKDTNIISPKQVFADKPYIEIGHQKPWSLWSKHLQSGGLSTKDIPLAISSIGEQIVSDFEYWAILTAMPDYSSPSAWRATLYDQDRNYQAVDKQFFTSSPYSRSEKRMISLYMLTHYLKAPLYIPGSYKASGQRLYNDHESWRAFTNLSFLADPTKQLFPWTIFHNTFPKVLGSHDSLEQIQENILPPPEDIRDSIFSRRFVFRRNRNMSQFKASTFRTAEQLKLFSSLNLLTFTGDRSIALAQPSVAILDRYCYQDRNSSLADQPCPMNLTQETDDEILAHGVLKDFLARTLAAKWCPLLSSPDWQEVLELKVIDQETCRFSAGQLFAINHDGFPHTFGKQVLADILNLGKNPILRPELHQLTSKIRFEKVKAARWNHSADYWLRTHNGLLSQKSGSQDWYFQISALNFRIANTSLLESYTGFLEELMGSARFNELSKQLALRSSDNNSRPVIRELLQIFVDHQSKLEEKGGSAVELFVSLAHSILSDEHLRHTMIATLSHHSSPSSHEFLATDFPAAVQGLFGLSFDWKDKGLLTSRFLINRDVMFGIRDLLLVFNHQQWDKTFLSLHQAMANLGTVQEQARVIQVLVRWITTTSLSFDMETKELNADGLEKLFVVWNQTSWGEDLSQKLNLSFDGMSIPLRGLSNQTQGNFLSISEELTLPLLKAWPKIARLHLQAHDSFEQELGFWSSLALDVLIPLHQNADGSQALNNLIKDPRLGFSNKLWVDGLRDARSLAQFDKAIAAISRARRDDWSQCIKDMDTLLPQLSATLRFVHERGQWHGLGHEELKNSFQSLLHLSENKEGLLDKQTEVVDFWLTAPSLLYD